NLQEVRNRRCIRDQMLCVQWFFMVLDGSLRKLIGDNKSDNGSSCLLHDARNIESSLSKQLSHLSSRRVGRTTLKWLKYCLSANSRGQHRPKLGKARALSSISRYR